MMDLWTYLTQTQKPIVLYGMGNGADKIIAILERYHIPIAGIFASNGFVRGNTFHGMVVESYAEIQAKYEDFIILLSFATSLPGVMERIYAMAEEHELYAPDVPVVGDGLFNNQFYQEHESDFEKAYALLADDCSREIYKKIIQYKLSGKISYLQAAQNEKFPPFKSYKNYVDLGAYNGDTIREMLTYLPDLEHIYAFEPDERNYKKLVQYVTMTQLTNIETYPIGAWSKADLLEFEVCGSRNSNLKKNTPTSKKTKLVRVDAIDTILAGKEMDYIKYDVEGAEKQALLGSKKSIETYHPDLMVSLYHRKEDLFDLILLVHELNPNYRLYLRRFPYIPAWDCNLYAIG